MADLKNLRVLMKKASLEGGSILVPHIDLYQSVGVFPKEWTICFSSHKEDDGLFHPSSHCLMTERELYWDRFFVRQKNSGVEIPEGKLLKRDEITYSKRRIYDCGHMWHAYFGNILVSMGFVDKSNVEKHIKYDVGGAIGSGTADLVKVRIPGYGEWLIDMKTLAKDSFVGGIPSFLWKKWVAQVNCYGDWLGISNMMILGIEKDSPHRLKEFVIERDEDLLNSIYQKWIYVEQCLNRLEPPKCTHSVNDECSLGDLCSYVSDLR